MPAVDLIVLLVFAKILTLFYTFKNLTRGFLSFSLEEASESKYGVVPMTPTEIIFL